MGVPRVTPQEIVKIYKLYKELGNYTALARILGRSSSTIAKYVQMKGVSQNIRIAVSNLTPINT
ncbi:MAG: helix-turn-helix domain-containing protein [Clostridiales bacterium]|nr:helix-turn-helix domain-containing protein [Clostridiales bacterium]